MAATSLQQSTLPHVHRRDQARKESQLRYFCISQCGTSPMDFICWSQTSAQHHSNTSTRHFWRNWAFCPLVSTAWPKNGCPKQLCIVGAASCISAPRRSGAQGHLNGWQSPIRSTCFEAFLGCKNFDQPIFNYVHFLNFVQQSLEYPRPPTLSNTTSLDYKNWSITKLAMSSAKSDLFIGAFVQAIFLHFQQK